MLRSLKELYSLLTLEQRRKFLRLQLLVVIMSFAEIASVVSIGPFMALVGDIGQLQGNGIPARIYQASGLATEEEFLFWTGIVVLCVLVVAGLFSMFTIWRLSLYGSYVGAELSNRLFSHYIHKPWLFHAGGNSSQLTNQIFQECLRVTNHIINPLMQMNAKLVMVTLLISAMFIYNPMVALAGMAIFGSAYMLLYRIVRRRLVRNGRNISSAQTMRFKLISEGFGGIKDVLLLNRQPIFIQRYNKASRKFAQSHGTTQALSQAPRYAIEVVAYGSVIFLILYLLAAYEGNLGDILPVLSVYALAGFKLLPAFQQIYSSISNIRGNLAALDAIRDDLKESMLMDGKSEKKDGTKQLVPKREIRLDEVFFSYPGKIEPVLNGLSLAIPANKVIGLVGASGSGKSTAIDAILGLIDPQQGSLLIDGMPLCQKNKKAWQSTLGFVPQSIFLADSSIRENIAFGLPREEIDESRVECAARMAHLDELLSELPDGLDTRVGERGIQLSGGQRQRIGIARALYDDAEVLVLDEATSALDGITEKLIMDAIHDFSGKKTIIMIAHRLATVKKCDQIYLMGSGKVIDSGNYEELIGRNDIFKRMAEHA